MIDEYLNLYEQTFHSYFPTYPIMLTMTEEEIIKLIDRCCDEGKDVYELGILSDDIDIKY